MNFHFSLVKAYYCHHHQRDRFPIILKVVIKRPKNISFLQTYLFTLQHRSKDTKSHQPSEWCVFCEQYR